MERVSALRTEIDRLDKKIMDLVRQRTQLAKMIGNMKVNAGGTRIDLAREQQVMSNYTAELPEGGAEIALLLFRLARGL